MTSINAVSITVSIPMEMPILIANDTNIYDAEQFFIEQRYATDIPEQKLELTKAKLVLKYAKTYFATLSEIHYEGNKLKFNLSFSSNAFMTAFCDTTGFAISSITME